MNNPNKWSSNRPQDIQAAIDGTLVIHGKKVALMPTLTHDPNDRVAPSKKSIKQILEHLRDTGNYYRWNTGLGANDTVTYIDHDGQQSNLCGDWHLFWNRLQTEFVFLQFVPGMDNSLEQRAVTAFETMQVVGGAIFGTILKKINWGDIPGLRDARRKPVVAAPVVKVVDPAEVSNAKYLEAMEGK